MNGTMGGAESGRQPTLTLHSPDEDGDNSYGTMGGAESGRQTTLTLHSPDEDGDEWLWYHGWC